MESKSLVPVKANQLPAKKAENTVHLVSLVFGVAVWLSFALGHFSLLSTVALSVLIFSLWVGGFVTTKLVRVIRKILLSRREMFERNRFYRQAAQAGLTAEVRRWEAQVQEATQQREKFIQSLSNYLSPGELTFRRFTEAHRRALELVERKLDRAHDLLQFALAGSPHRLSQRGDQSVHGEVRACLEDSDALLVQLRHMHLQLINTFTDSSRSDYVSTTKELDHLLERIKSYSEPSSLGEREDPSSI